MDRKLMTGLLTILLIGSLLAEGIGPAWGQDDMETFRKPSWRLTVQYPPGWELSEESGVVSFVFDDGEGDTAIFAVAQDPDYADTELSLEDLFWIFMDKVGGQAESLSVEETDPRQIAGVEARSGLLTATDAASGLEMGGGIYQLVKGGKGYLVLTLATWDYLDIHQPDFDAMLDSLRIGAAAPPTKTPTPKKATPRPRRTARPAAMPTEEVLPTEEVVETPEAEPTEEIETPEAEVTEEAIDTPEAEVTEEAVETPEAKSTEAEATAAATAAPAITVTPTVTITAAAAITVTPTLTVTRPTTATAAAPRGGYLSARAAYDLAARQASTWEGSPILTFARCPEMELSGPDAGKCASWNFQFAKLKGKELQGFEVLVEDGAVASSQELGPGVNEHEIASNWGDSPEVLSLARKQMSPGVNLEKLYGRPSIEAELRGSSSGPEESYWRFWIRGLSAPPNSSNQREMWKLTARATSGDLFELEPSPNPNAQAGKAGTAREALAVAEKKARQWNKDARLVAASGEARAGDPGQQDGETGLWTFQFNSQSAEQTRSFQVQDGQVVLEENAFAYSKDPVIAGEWPDSPAALDGFMDKYPSYDAFVKQFPEHDWMMALGQVDDITRWWIWAMVPGIELFINPASR